MNFINNSFFRNILLITSGTAAVQILNMICSPIITRLYTPEQYGIISIFTAVLSTFGFVGTLNYEMGIPIEKDDNKVINILFLSIITLCINVTLLSIGLYCFGNEWLKYLNADILIRYKYLVPLGLFFIGLYNVFTQLAFRNKDFKVVTKTKFTQSFYQNTISITCGFLKLGELGLLISRIMGQSAGITTLTFKFLKKEKFKLSTVDFKGIQWAAKRYIKFPIFTTPRRFFGDFSVSLPTLMMTMMYGGGVVGAYALANNIVQLPMMLIGTSISNVFYAEVASLGRENPKKIKYLTKKLLVTLFIVGIVPLLIFIIFAPRIFIFIFGEEWYEAGIYAQILSLAVFFRLLFKPISNIFDVFERQSYELYLSILRVTLIFITFVLGNYLKLNSYLVIGLYSIVTAGIYLIQFLLAQYVINQQIKEL